jgi:hypothetical protein
MNKSLTGQKQARKTMCISDRHIPYTSVTQSAPKILTVVEVCIFQGEKMQRYKALILNEPSKPCITLGK